MTISSVVVAVVVVVGLTACITDVRTRRIPNVLTFGAAAAALIFHLWFDGIAGLGLAGGGWLVGVLVFLPFFLLGGMGAGDVKLLAALGAWLGAGNVFWVAVYGSLAGGLMAIVVAFGHGYLRTALGNIGSVLQYWWLVGPRRMPAMTLEDSKAPRLAYAVPIFVGTLVTLWLH